VLQDGDWIVSLASGPIWGGWPVLSTLRGSKWEMTTGVLEPTRSRRDWQGHGDYLDRSNYPLEAH
jgi:hypothetical protein